MEYSDAIVELKKARVPFAFPVAWGLDLQTEHERYLTEQVVGGPVFVVNYPKGIKAFYMRRNDDGRTVAAMDLLVPKVGEIIGGSQREERLDLLEGRMAEMGIPAEGLWWYLDSRRWGSCPHAGFGLGFERLIMYLTGMENIRDVIPFPRTPRHAEF
jgi:asparaginyl-tRNA synthetase